MMGCASFSKQGLFLKSNFERMESCSILNNIGVQIGKNKCLKTVTSENNMLFPPNSAANRSIAGQSLSEYQKNMFPEYTDVLKSDIGCTITKKD